MVGRRTLLGALGTVLVGAAAGCSGGSDDGSPTERESASEQGSATRTATPTTTATPTATPAPEPPAFVDRLYDPAAVAEFPNSGFVSIDVGALYDRLDSFPDWLGAEVRSYDEQYDSVSVPEVGRFTAQTYWEGETPSVGDGEALAGSLHATSGVDAERARSTMQAIMRNTGRSMDARGSVAGYDVYGITLAGSVPIEAGFGDRSVVGGAVANVDIRPREPLAAALGVDDPPAYDPDLARRLLGPVGDAPAVAGVRADLDAYLAGVPDGTALAPIRDGLEGVAAGTRFEGAEAVSTLVAVYGAGSAPTAGEVSAVLEWGGIAGTADATVGERRVVLENGVAAEEALSFAREGIGPVEFAVLLAGAAFTPAVPWL